jgi:autotransporter-associated beta strand protein
MKAKRSNPLFARFFRSNTLTTAVVVSLTGFAMQPTASAANLYWDTNGATADSGNAGGTWDSGTNWTADGSGASGTIGWTDGESAVFAAGTDGTGAYTVTIAGTVTTPSILAEEAGGKTIAGGTINIGGGSINTAVAGNGNVFTISSIIAGSGGLTLAANGDTSQTGGGVGGALLLSGANTISGDITITSGVVRSNSGFGGSGNKIILSGGGIVDTGANTNFANNIEVPAGKTGVYRTYGGVTTAQISGTITGSGDLMRTDGGTLTINGNASAFTGKLINARGTLILGATSTNWSNADVLQTDGGNVLRLGAAGDTTIKSLTSDRDVVIPFGSRLNILSGTYTTVGAGVDNNGWWAQGTTAGNAAATGSITSSSGSLTLTNGAATGNLPTTDNQLRLKIVDFDGSTPLAFTKNHNNSLGLDLPSTYTGGTTINGGRINTANVNAFGTGVVTVNSGGQAYLTVGAGTYASNFVINGLGATETAGVLGAIRFQNNTVSGSINVASAARVGAYNSTGTHSGALTGSADLQINSNDANFNGTINFTGDTSAYSGTMTVTQGALNVAASNLGGNLVLEGRTATAAAGATVTAAGTTATVNGNIAGSVTANGGTATADGVAAIATAGGGTATVNGSIGGNLTINGGTANATNDGVATASGGFVTANGPITGNVTVGDGATLAGEPTVTGSLSLGASNGSTLRIKAGTAGFLNAEAVTLTGANTVILDTLPTAPGPFVVLGYNTLTSGDESNFVVPSGIFRGNPQVVHDDTNKVFTLELNSQVRTWNGAISTDWNTTEENWDEGEQKFFSGDEVVFADNGVGTVNLIGNLAPQSVKMQNTVGNNFAFAGAGGIVGSTGIAMTGGGNLTLGGVNSFSGAVTVSAGQLTLSSPQALGQTSGVTVAAGTRVDLAGQGVGNTTNTTWIIAGEGSDGAGGLGAVTNSAGDIYEDSSINNLTLAANAEIGGNNGRFDVGRNGINGSGGLINGAGFTLTKVGSNSMVFRGPATNISYVINAGMLTFEDYDTASGTNPIIVNTPPVQDPPILSVVGSYGNRTLPNDVTLNTGTRLISQAGNGIWTGTVTAAAGATFQADGNLVLDGALVSSSDLVKNGGGALVLQNDGSSFSGKVLNNAGTLRVESNASLGSYAGADAITIVGTLQSGTIAALASATVGSATKGITQTGNVTYDGGAGNTLTVDGAITGLGNVVKANNTSTAIFNKNISVAGLLNANGGAQTFNGNVTLGGTFEVGTDIVTNLNSPTWTAPGGFKAWTGVTNINVGTGTLQDMEIQQGTGQPHTVNHIAGALAVATDIRIGHWGGATSVYNMSGGSITQPDTVTNPTDEGQANLFLGIDGTGVLNHSGGTINTTSMVVDGRGDTAGDDIYAMTGGRLNMGKWGIRSGNAGVSKQIQLGGGIVGASADWVSGMAMTLTGTNGDVTFNTLDSVDATTPRNITLTGVLGGSGGLVKTGAGILTLNNAANTFTGTALVNGGRLFVNSGAAAAGSLRTAAGGTLQAGTVAGPGLATTTNLTLDGGNADFRIGNTTDMIVVSGSFTAPTATAIRAIPGNAIAAPQTFDIIDYSGTFTGLANLTFASSNPHLTGELINDEINTVIQVKINTADTVTWKGNVNGNWDVNTTSNWVLGSDGVTSSKYYDVDVVKFDDGGIGTPTVSLVGTINPATMTVENTAGNYTFQGSGIGGSGGLTKTGGGTLTLLTNNTFTGPVSIQGGRVVVGNGGADGTLGGTGNVPLADGTSLAFNRTGATLFPTSRLITGGGSVEKDGTGSLELQGINSFTGGLTINGGSVILSTSGGDAGVVGGTVTVNSGGTLSGTSNNAFGYGANRIQTLNINGGTVTTSANGDQGWGITVNMTSGTLGSTGPGYYSLGGGSSVNILASANPAMVSGAIRIREGNAGDLLPFSVADGAAAVDLTVSESISEQGGVRGISKTGPGTMEMAGANTFSGPVNVGEGTLLYTRPVHSVIPNALTGSGGTLVHNSPQELVLSGDGSAFGGTIDANGKIVRLVGDTSGSGTDGTLALEGGTLALGLNTEGLLFYGTLAGETMNTTPLDTTVLSDSAAALHGGIAGNTTNAYDGEIYLTAGDWSFGENVDDAVYVNINGVTLINDNQWNVPTTGTFTAPADGWYSITLRVQNGGGGNGPVDAWATAGIGIGIKTGPGSTNVADYTKFNIGALGTKCRVVRAAGTHTMAGGLTLGGGVANTINTGDGSLAINGVITGGASDSLVKIGTGTLALNGANTYSGDTLVSAGVLAVDGTSIRNSSKLVIDGGTVEVTGNELVGSLFFGAAQQGDGTYGSSLSSATFKNDALFSGTGVIVVGGTAGYSDWASINAPTGTPGDDFDGDGVSNGVEWVLGGGKDTNDIGKLPKLSTTGGNLVFTFKRDQASISPDTSLKIDVGTDLASWPVSYPVPDAPVANNPGVSVVDNLDGTDTVTLTVPQAPDAKKFARLNVVID